MTPESREESLLSSFEDQFYSLQERFRDLLSVRGFDDLKDRWEEVSERTAQEVREHPFQMLALGSVVGFSLGLVGKSPNLRQVSSRVVDWAAKLGASWAVDQISRKPGSSDHSVH